MEKTRNHPQSKEYASRKPLISVIVPVFNVDEYLPRCLKAISEQTYRNLEIILVDDGSTDRSGILCEEFAARDSRARVIHQPNTGLWAARNTGHDAAHGDYLFFPDADDYFHREMIHILLEAINSGNGYDLALCRISKTDNDREDVSTQISVSMTEKSRDDLFRNLFREKTEDPYSVFMWNKLFRSQLIKDFRTNPYARSQDKDYMMRLFLQIDRAILAENRLYYWMQRTDSLTHSRNNMRIYNECRTMMCYKNLPSMSGEYGQYAHYLLDELYVRLLFWRHQSWNTPNRAAVVSECRKIMNDTYKAYRSCREISIWRRIVCLILVRHPRFAHELMTISGN